MPVGTTYYDAYINRVSQTHSSISNALANGFEQTTHLLQSLPGEKWGYRYEPEKWSIKEVVQHIIDAERIFGVRALCIARGEEQNLPGFDENVYAQNSFADYKQPAALMAEYQAVRQSTRLLFDSFGDDVLKKTGNANNIIFTVEEIGFITAGHELHHIDVLSKRYL